MCLQRSVSSVAKGQGPSLLGGEMVEWEGGLFGCRYRYPMRGVLAVVWGDAVVVKKKVSKLGCRGREG